MPSLEDDWSESDDDIGSDVETSVLLGVPDGPIEASNDELDAAVSRLGGRPAFLPSYEPPLSSSQCKNCSFPMELLVQVWCPFENSPMDRALYVWGCSRSECQRKEGSVRTWRGLRYNRQYATKLEKKLAKQKEKEMARQAEEAKRAEIENNRKINPFTMNASSNAPAGLFGGGFGAQGFVTSGNITDDKSQESNIDATAEDEQESDEPASIDGSDSELVTAMASTAIDESPWLASPAYSPPQYLSTSSEYLPPAPKTKLPAGIDVRDPALDEDDGEKGKGPSWAFEGYENSLEVDHVFERFVKRAGVEGQQCLRYELGGTPLPYSSDSVFQKLFPAPPSVPLPVTKPDFKVIPPAAKRTFTPSSIPSCSHCGSRRVFECQLMPNLINVLKASSASESVGEMGGKKTDRSDKDRIQEVERALKGGSASSESRGMEWGTCMVFSCENDCCLEDKKDAGTMPVDAKECWREEIVLIQWDE